jgi:hypothetical protein
MNTSKTQLNFEGGVNRKVTPNAAGCGEAERGEAKKQQENFNWTHEKCTEDLAAYPDTTREMNFPNGQ